MKRYLITLTVFIFAHISAFAQTPAYLDRSLSPSERTADLLSRMTVEEKIGQLLCPLGWPMYEKTSADSTTESETFRDFILNRHGGMLWATFRADPWTQKTLETGLNPELAAETYNRLQKYAIENSRFGIPVFFAEEAPHGHMAIGTTVFPTGIGMASTWDTALLEQVGTVVADELKAQGGHIGYGPVVDLAREPRWSRVEETYGEDRYLTSSMASAMVRGLAGNGVISTLKHFVAYGVPEGGHNGSQAVIGERELYENFLPPFKSCIDAGALSVMTSYNSIDGVPCTANSRLIKGLLYEKWGFGGFVVSDLGSVSGLRHSHHIVEHRSEAALMALKAGVSVELGAETYPMLAEAFKDGTLDMKMLDEAAGRVLKLKFETGLFDNPYVDPSYASGTVGDKNHRKLSRQVAREGIVLLENDGVLPLKKGTKILVTGPNADNIYNQLGDYTAPQRDEDIVTVLEGIRNINGDRNTLYVKGCAVRDTVSENISDAVAAASSADVIVAVVGGSSARDFKTRYIETGAASVDPETVSDMESGEGFDRSSLKLLGLQEELLRSLKATGKKLVVVYIEGRPLDKTWAKDNADALLTAWYPGQEGGNAIADVLFGKYNPSGRLPVSVPVNTGQLPVYYNRKMPLGTDYVEHSRKPLYEFGYGLSYTDYEYSDLKIVCPDEDTSPVIVSFNITNVGDTDGHEVAQLYFTDPVASTVRPVRQLAGFTRVYVPAGKSVEVSIALDKENLMLYDPEMNHVLEPGRFIISVGASSEDIRLEGEMMLRP